MGWGGGAKSNDGDKAWSSINHSIHFGGVKKSEGSPIMLAKQIKDRASWLLYSEEHEAWKKFLSCFCIDKRK